MLIEFHVIDQKKSTVISKVIVEEPIINVFKWKQLLSVLHNIDVCFIRAVEHDTPYLHFKFSETDDGSMKDIMDEIKKCRQNTNYAEKKRIPEEQKPDDEFKKRLKFIEEYSRNLDESK